MDQIKQVILVREDLKLPTGKLCSQVAHASLKAVCKAKEKSPNIVKNWKSQGAKKIILKVKTKEDMKKLSQKARRKGVSTSLIKDRGLTVIEPGTITCAGIGPASSKEINDVTGHLELL